MDLGLGLGFLHLFDIKMRWSPVLIQTTTLFFVQKYKSWIAGKLLVAEQDK